MTKTDSTYLFIIAAFAIGIVSMFVFATPASAIHNSNGQAGTSTATTTNKDLSCVRNAISVRENSIAEAERGFKQGVLDVNTFLQAETQSHEVIDQIFFSWMDYMETLSGLALMNGDELSSEKL